MGQVGIIERIAKDAGVDLIRRGQASAYISVTDAQRILASARKFGVRLLGIEGFHLDGERLIPDTAAIASFPTLRGQPDAAERSIREASEFVKELGSDVDLYYFTWDE